MKNWAHILVCLLISAGIWLIHNLSLEYSDIVNVPLSVSSNLEGYSSRSSTEPVISARVHATGFSLIRLSLNRKRTVSVFIDKKDFIAEDRESGSFAVPSYALNKYVNEIFGDGVSLESFVTDGLHLRFTAEYCRKVPVRAVTDFSFKPQYTAVAPVNIQPDSVLVYGDESRLENVTSVISSVISAKELARSISGVARLETPSGLRLSEDQVNYRLEVSRFVEIETQKTLRTVNVPEGTLLSVLPATVTVKFRCVFPLLKDPSEIAELYVDYDEFAGSLNGKCVVHCRKLPEGVIGYDISPEVCECIVVSAN